MATKKKYGIEITKDLYVQSIYLRGESNTIIVAVGNGMDEENITLSIPDVEFMSDGYGSVVTALDQLAANILKKIEKL